MRTLKDIKADLDKLTRGSITTELRDLAASLRDEIAAIWPYQDFTYTVTIHATTLEEAEQILTERLDHDEDYGFPYSVSWEPV